MPERWATPEIWPDRQEQGPPAVERTDILDSDAVAAAMRVLDGTPSATGAHSSDNPGERVAPVHFGPCARATAGR